MSDGNEQTSALTVGHLAGVIAPIAALVPVVGVAARWLAFRWSPLGSFAGDLTLATDLRGMVLNGVVPCLQAAALTVYVYLLLVKRRPVLLKAVEESKAQLETKRPIWRRVGSWILLLLAVIFSLSIGSFPGTTVLCIGSILAILSFGVSVTAVAAQTRSSREYVAYLPF
jgi:hypothetical protein